MRCRHNCFEGHQSDHTFALPGYNECSLGVVITTPSLSANKGSLRPWITHGSWGGGSVGVTHSFPLFLINSRAGTCSQGASPVSRSFTLASFFCPLLGFIRFLTNKERNDLLASQARADAEPEGFQVTGTRVVGRTGGNPKSISKSWEHLLTSQDDRFFQSRCLLFLLG